MKRRLAVLLLVSVSLLQPGSSAGVPLAPQAALAALTFERGVDKDSLGGMIGSSPGGADGMLTFRVRLNNGGVWPTLGRGLWQGWLSSPSYERSFGVVTPDVAATPSAFRIVSRDWSTNKYAYDYAGGTLGFRTSRLSPAFLVESTSRTLNLFVGADPAFRFLAVPTSDGVRTYTPGQVVDAAPSEPWLLVWYDTTQTFRQFEPLGRRYNYFKDQEASVWLIVLQHRPSSIDLTSTGLQLSFGDETGSVAGLPLQGVRFVEQGETDGWSTALPSSVIDKARYWTRALRYYPLDVQEDFALDEVADKVVIRQTLTYLPIVDDWGTSGLKLAPLPPTIALAHRYRTVPGEGDSFPITFSGAPKDLDYPTANGPYMGIEGADAYTYELSGLLRFVKQFATVSGVTGADDLLSDLRQQVQSIVESGHQAPGQRLWGWSNHVFWFEGEVVTSLAQTMPLLTDSGASDLKTHLREEVQGYLVNGQHLNWERSGQVGTPDTQQLQWWNNQAIVGERLYALWAYLQHTGDLATVDANWPFVLDLLGNLTGTHDWALGYRWGPKFTANNTYVSDLNNQIGGLIGLARLARKHGDETLFRYAAYLATKELAVRYALGNYVYPYMYQYGILKTPPLPWQKTGTNVTYYGNALTPVEVQFSADGSNDDRQVVSMDQTEAVIGSSVVNYQYTQLVGYDVSTPELMRFLATYLRGKTTHYLRSWEATNPWWYWADLSSHGGAENGYETPFLAFSIFQAKAQVEGADRATLRSQLPWALDSYGARDIYRLQNLWALLKEYGTVSWGE